MNNLEIAQAAKLRPIADVATEAGLTDADFEPLGRYKAKLTTEGIARLKQNGKRGKLILVSAITPTTKGEGKTTVTIGLSQGLNKIAHAISATREPALGPIFGVKGGACGGGYSQVLPMEDINLFFTGDFPAITAAHNLLSAMLDAHVHHGNALGIDLKTERWPRTLDMNDRALRSIITSLGGATNGPAREGSFVITPASEIMAILCLSRSLADLKENLGNIVAAVNTSGAPVTARDLKADGAMAALLRDAIRPNLVQTIEGGLAFVHGGPFGNIAHGCSSILATECAVGLADYVVTEAGFASDLGAEKFLNIVCPRLGYGPDAIVLVASIKALAHHGEGDLAAGLPNLFRHLSHLQAYGPRVVVAINRFADDTDEDHEIVKSACAARGVLAVTCNPFAGGGEGCLELAEAVAQAAAEPNRFTPAYTETQSIEEKLTEIVKKVYGGNGVVFEGTSRKDLTWLKKHGYADLPVCVAKTQYSFSDDATRTNAPTGFDLHLKGLRASAGAGFIVVTCGEIMLMPGLGKAPTAQQIDVDADGRITGLF
jgi:formate--tetrahydrofolate ligase